MEVRANAWWRRIRCQSVSGVRSEIVPRHPSCTSRLAMPSLGAINASRSRTGVWYLDPQFLQRRLLAQRWIDRVLVELDRAQPRVAVRGRQRRQMGSLLKAFAHLVQWRIGFAPRLRQRIKIAHARLRRSRWARMR